jgi:cytochrome c oxidase subunit 2
MTNATYFSASGFAPVSPQATNVNHLMWVSLAVFGCIFLLVTALIAIGLVRSAVSRDGSEEPVQVHGNVYLEIGWTLGSLLTVAVLFGLTVPVLHSTHPFESGDTPPSLTVIGHQWWWEVRYPTNPPIYTANEVHIPVGQKSLLALQAADVIHDFWVPQLGPKQDMIPGTTQHLWLEPRAAGTYDGACAEFCGNEHAWMRIRVIAESPADYQAWIQKQQAALQVAGVKAQHGQQLFVQNACNSCHAVGGEGARIAPDLTHVAERQTLGSGVIQNSPANLALWIKDPQAVKPQCNMPSFQLSDSDVDDLTTYLEGVQDASGSAQKAGRQPEPNGGGLHEEGPPEEATPIPTSTPTTNRHLLRKEVL